MRLTIEVAAGHDQLRRVRRFVRTWADLLGLDDPRKLEMIATELTSNAIQASPPGAPVEVTLEQSGPTAVLTVADHGPGFPGGPFPMPPDRATGGRGLAIVDRLADHLTVERVGGRTVVRALALLGTLER